MVVLARLLWYAIVLATALVLLPVAALLRL
jgi:hypothetical protein